MVIELIADEICNGVPNVIVVPDTLSVTAIGNVLLVFIYVHNAWVELNPVILG